MWNKDITNYMEQECQRSRHVVNSLSIPLRVTGILAYTNQFDQFTVPLYFLAPRCLLVLHVCIVALRSWLDIEPRLDLDETIKAIEDILITSDDKICFSLSQFRQLRLVTIGTLYELVSSPDTSPDDDTQHHDDQSQIISCSKGTSPIGISVVFSVSENTDNSDSFPLKEKSSLIQPLHRLAVSMLYPNAILDIQSISGNIDNNYNCITNIFNQLESTEDVLRALESIPSHVETLLRKSIFPFFFARLTQYVSYPHRGQQDKMTPEKVGLPEKAPQRVAEIVRPSNSFTFQEWAYRMVSSLSTSAARYLVRERNVEDVSSSAVSRPTTAHFPSESHRSSSFKSASLGLLNKQYFGVPVIVSFHVRWNNSVITRRTSFPIVKSSSVAKGSFHFTTIEDVLTEFLPTSVLIEVTQDVDRKGCMRLVSIEGMRPPTQAILCWFFVAGVVLTGDLHIVLVLG